MKSDNKKLNKWVPAISVIALFLVIGCFGSWVGVEATPLAAGLVAVGLLASFDVFSPPDFSFKDCWYNYIQTETHIIIIAIAAICTAILLFFIVPQYEISIIKKKK